MALKKRGNEMTDSLEGLSVELRKAVKTTFEIVEDSHELDDDEFWLPAGLAAKEQERIREAMKGLIIDVLKKYAPEFTEDGDAKKAMKIIKVELKKVEEAFGK